MSLISSIRLTRLDTAAAFNAGHRARQESAV
jgi:hypothetical protein